jgi:hypothetical protein
VSVRRTILIEEYLPALWRGNVNVGGGWCAREYVQHSDESRTRTTLFTAPTRDEVADWYAEYLRERREP